MVSAEPYWHEGKAYNWSAQEEHEASKIAAIAAKRINVPFLVVDMAMKDNGEWIVIECNDAQESGYAGNSPLGLWKKVIELESGR